MTRIVQFLHPGGEHGFDEWLHGSHGWKEWNDKPAHRRKYLHAGGAWTRDPSQEPSAGRITFWGEWEPQSRVAELVDGDQQYFPRFVHEAQLKIDVLYDQPARFWQNTDPLVFGDRFRYAICRQFTRRNRRTKVSKLESGDIILFGSRVGRHFALDTVFVVDQYSDFQALGELPAWESDLHRWVAVEREPIPPCGLRLYGGRTWSATGPFSYVPCLPVAGSPLGRPRPWIEPFGVLGDIIRPGMTQGFKQTILDEPDCGHEVWRAVTDQVLQQGWALGVAINEPNQVNC